MIGAAPPHRYRSFPFLARHEKIYLRRALRDHSMSRTWKTVVALGALISGCQFWTNPILDAPIAASGLTRSPPFRLYRQTTYNLAFGLDPVMVSEAACAAVYVQKVGHEPPQPCREVTPRVGKFFWKVTQGDAVIATGSMDAQPEGLPGNHPSWAKDKTTSWSVFPGWFGRPGGNYVLEIHSEPSSIDLTPYRPRIAIIEPL